MATDPGQESPVRALLRMTPPRDEGARFFLGLPPSAVVDFSVVDFGTFVITAVFRGDYL